MTTKREFCIVPNCSQGTLGIKVNEEKWQIQYMQFMQDGTLHVVFVREVTVNEPAPETVVVESVTVEPVRPIPNKPLPVGTVIVTEPPRSVPLTHNRPEKGATRPVTVPVGDPVMREAYERGQAAYDKRMAEGATVIKNARPSFIRNQ